MEIPSDLFQRAYTTLDATQQRQKRANAEAAVLLRKIEERKQKEQTVLNQIEHVDALILQAAGQGEEHADILTVDKHEFMDTNRLEHFYEYGVFKYPVFNFKPITDLCRALEAQGFVLVVYAKKSNRQEAILRAYIQPPENLDMNRAYNQFPEKEIKKNIADISPTTERPIIPSS